MELTLPPHLLLFDPDRAAARERKVKNIVDERDAHDRRILCAACRHPVTHQSERLYLHGAHEHRFTNPHGITYRIGCFGDAAGCTAVGTATEEFTWFRGYAWRIAVCKNCQTHLGWRFQAAQDYFHGLILDRLVPAAG
jgi:hypothetical protein